MKNDIPTLDQPEIPDHPKCFKCERYIKCAVKTGSADDYWDCPWGLVLRGGGNFGSTHYDSLVDGIGVDVVICDECLVKYGHLLREVERGEPCDGRFAALQALVERSQTEKKDPEETGS
jgi:hypothetical protein